MLRRFLVLSAVIVCAMHGVAQKTISKTEFGHLVDYANCRYVMTFIEKNDLSNPNFTDTYEKRVKPELSKATLDNLEEVASTETLNKLLANNGPAYSLVQKVEELKQNYDRCATDDSLIASLKMTAWQKVDLSATAEAIRKEMLAKYASNKGAKSASGNAAVASQASNGQFQEEGETPVYSIGYQDYQESLRTFKLIVTALLGLIFILLAVLFFMLLSVKKKMPGREYVIEQVLNSKRISRKFNPKKPSSHSSGSGSSAFSSGSSERSGSSHHSETSGRSSSDSVR